MAASSLEAGGYSAYEATGIVNIPIGETAALRLGYRHNERDNFYDSITGDYTGNPGEVDNNSYRLGFLWQPSDSFSGLLKVDYHDLDFGGNVTTVFGEEPLGDVVQNADFAYTDESTRVVLDLKYEFGGGVTLSSLSGYQDIESVNNLDLNATIPPVLRLQQPPRGRLLFQEFNLLSPDDQPFRWTSGLFWQRQDSHFWTGRRVDSISSAFLLSAFLTTPTVSVGHKPMDNEEDDKAVFAHGRYRFNDQWELEAGVRYGEYDRDSSHCGSTTCSIPKGAGAALNALARNLGR